MNLQMDLTVARGYKSPSQIAKVVTENWMRREGYCPSCYSNLKQSKANSRVLDFDCPNCKNQYELKGKKSKHAKKVTDGAYESMIERIYEDNSPHFFFLAYDQSFSVQNLVAVPNYFFQSSVIEKRKPLSPTAKRAGWIGCNILLDQIPDIGKIKLIENSRIVEPTTVHKIWQKTAFLGQQKQIENRGWTLDVMKCIEMLGTKNFSLQQVYSFESYLSLRHPGNKHIQEKIRQQLQLLRDKGFLDFIRPGFYQLTEN